MTNRAFDVSKFRKNLTKAVPGMSTGFNDPRDWISTGNYCLNYLMSGDFTRGVPLGKVTMFAGESGAGKSFVASGNLVKNAQAQDILPVILDTENALDEDWLKALGIDTDPEKLMRFGVSMVDEVAKFISEFMKAYKDEYGDLPYEEQKKIMFVVDSVGMLLTPTDINQFEGGDLKGDMGRKAKALTALIKNTVNRIAPHPVGLVVTNHTYASQDMFDPDDKITGGAGFVYASSRNILSAGSTQIEGIIKEDIKVCDFQMSFMRKDPPVDENYINALHLLGLAEKQGAIIFNKQPYLFYGANNVDQLVKIAKVRSIYSLRESGSLIMQHIAGVGHEKVGPVSR